jgi:O-methyltransferase
VRLDKGRGLRTLGRWERRARSVIKRTVLKPINASNSFFVQAVPEYVHNRGIDLQGARSDWTRQGISVTNESDLVRMIFLIANVNAVLAAAVPGAFAELGVWQGSSAKLLRRLAPDRRLYLFDTFSGFDAADAADDPSGTSAGFFSDTSLERVQRFVGTDNVVYCVGRFPETADRIPEDECFAVVHIDMDLYESTKQALEYFYPRMAKGGLVIIHDYAGGSWPGVAAATDEFLAARPERPIVIPDRCGTAAFVKLA